MSDDAGRRPMTHRTRDFTVLTGTTALVLFLLVATNALGLIEAVSALGVIGSVAAAYFVGSATRAPPAPAAAEAPAQTAAPDTSGLLAALALPALEIGPGQKILAYNDAADDLFGLRALPFTRASAVIRSPSLLAAIDQALDPDATGPLAVSAELETGPDETWRAHVSPITSSGHVLLLLEDLTPVKRAARARADFLANASHELRTPLTAISGFIETMRGPARDDPAAWPRFLDIMAGESDRMSRLIADLLSLSRIESSERVLPRGRENFAGIIAASLAVLQPAAAERGITLKAGSAPTGLPDITAHRDELIQVVENLVSNAVKYAKSGGTVILHYGAAPTLTDAQRAAAQGWDASQRMTLLQAPARGQAPEPAVWLRVEDDGPGIAREHLPRLGERFYRADASRGGPVPGTGLGLAIVKHIMAHHRGGLAVETREGQGSAFGVWMPAGRE